MLLERFGKIEGIVTPKPEVAFHLLPDIPKFMARHTTEGTSIDVSISVATSQASESLGTHRWKSSPAEPVATPDLEQARECEASRDDRWRR